jgi:hypothetical protein
MPGFGIVKAILHIGKAALKLTMVPYCFPSLIWDNLVMEVAQI